MVRISAALTALALAPAAFATIFVTSPVASTTCPAGTECTVAWKDDGNAPSLAQFGNASVAVYVGSQQVQTLLQMISPSVNVATTNTIVFTPTANIGPNSADYFIKFVSASLKQNGTTIANTPEEAFSAKFTLSGMSGQFNATVQSEINAATGASTGATASASNTAAKSSSSAVVTKSSSGTASATKSSTSSTATSGAERLVAGSVVAAVSLGAILLGLL